MRIVVMTFLVLVGVLALPVLAQDATPIPGSDQQATPAASPEAQVQTLVPGPAFIRAAHFVADAGVFDVYINGELAIEDVNPNAVSQWLEVPSGTMSLAFVPAGESFSNAVIGPFNVTLNGNTRTTIAASGSVDADTLSPLIINEGAAGQRDVDRVSRQGNTNINILDTLSETSPVNIELFLVRPLPATTDDEQEQIALTPSPGATFTFESETLGDDIETFSVPAGIYNIRITSEGVQAPPGLGPSPRQDLLTFSNVALNPNTSYLFAVTDTAEGPWLVIQPSEIGQPVTLQGSVNAPPSTQGRMDTGSSSSSTGGSTGPSYP